MDSVSRNWKFHLFWNPITPMFSFIWSVLSFQCWHIFQLWNPNRRKRSPHRPPTPPPQVLLTMKSNRDALLLAPPSPLHRPQSPEEITASLPGTGISNSTLLFPTSLCGQTQGKTRTPPVLPGKHLCSQFVTQWLTSTKNHLTGRQPAWPPLFTPLQKGIYRHFFSVLLQNKLTDWLFEVLAVSADWCPRIWVLYFLGPIHPNFYSSHCNV